MNRIVLSLVVVAFAACGQGAPAQLDGSLTAVVDVTYDRATLETRDGFLTLRFQQKRGTAEDTVLKVGVIIDGTISGDGTGRASAALASPFAGVTPSAPHTLRLGRQQMSGRGEVFAVGNFSVLRYEMAAMTVQLSAAINVFGLFTITSSLVNATRAAVNIANFR